MKKTKHYNQDQFGFDFESEFNFSIETASKLNSELNVIEKEIDSANRTIQTTASSSESAEYSDDKLDNNVELIQSSRLGHSRQMGSQQSRKIKNSGVGRGFNSNDEIVRSADYRGGDTRHGGNGWVGGSREIKDDGDRNGSISDFIIDKLSLPKGVKAKFNGNIEAIKLLKTLELENRNATTIEQEILSKYVGFGGLSSAFSENNPENLRLLSVLSDDEYNSARRSTQDAHYTPSDVVNAIYYGLDRLGYKGGNVLEPSAGIGNFIGLMPREMKNNSNFTAVEIDPISARISKKLYPLQSIINKGFEEINIPSDYFDMVIGNPPFGNQSLFDPNNKDITNLSIHNYFIAKSLNNLKSGGIGAFVVSRYFLDAESSTAREYIAEKAHFLGAIRLPTSAFKDNALTEVTTDIVFFQKIKETEIPEKNWIEIVKLNEELTGTEFSLNKYFHDNPNQMIGVINGVTNQFGKTVEWVLSDDKDIYNEIIDRINVLPKNIALNLDPVIKNENSINVDLSNYKIGAFFLLNNERIAQRLPDVLDKNSYVEITPKNEIEELRIKGMIDIKENLVNLIKAESVGDLDENLVLLRQNLNKSYDAFLSTYGHVCSQVNKRAMQRDVEYPLLQSLEVGYDKGVSKELAKKDGVDYRPPSAKKADIFNKRVIKPFREIESVESAKDSFLVSMNEKGRVDIPFMMRLTGLPSEKIIEDLDGLILLDPISKEYVSAESYLTGNVKEKLKIATEALKEDQRFLSNVRMLEKIQPQDIDPVDISLQLGSAWVPSKYIEDFARHLYGDEIKVNINYEPSIGRWSTDFGYIDRAINHIKYGTSRIGSSDIFDAILTNRNIQVKDKLPDGEYIVNHTETANALQKSEEIKQAFSDWVWNDELRRDHLRIIYNDKFNTHISSTFDGSHLTLPNSSLNIELRKNQKDGIWRGVQNGTALLDHVVGAGKTYTMIGIAMELRRTGLANKPMFVVPNHLLLDWKDAFYSLYPKANILIADKDDFSKENREKLFGHIATGSWDAVIVAHSSFKKIGMPEDTLNKILNEQVDDLIIAIDKAKRINGDRLTIKQMEKAKDRMLSKLEKASDKENKDKSITFDMLGVDTLFVDESQEFKNLFISTSLSNVSGLGNLSGSDKAFDLFVKARYLQKKYNGRGLFFGTGTPISNTIAEVYTLQRFMQYDELKNKGIHHFDSWASTFGQVVTGWELDATGVNYKINNRFSKFQNVPELKMMYEQFADVVTINDLKENSKREGKVFPVPRIKGGKPENIIVKRSEFQENYMGVQKNVFDEKGMPVFDVNGNPVKEWNENSIIYRMENLPKDPRIDNPLKITNDARKAGLDYRLIDPDALDVEDSKINKVVLKTTEIYNKFNIEKGTQLIFCDLSTPKLKNPKISIADDQFSMDELISSGNKFNVYDDIKSKLIASGIPENEIAFIHDANTDLKKSKLFRDMNQGKVRILLGSTFKMGAGTNVQRLLVAEHHIDCPWRPSDLEQREGRIIRQGNKLYEKNPDKFEVEIIRYATEKTYDSRMWQTIESKASGIEQFRKGGGLRVIDDISSEAANAAEMKASATGNRLIFEQVKIQSELKKTEALFSNYKRNIHYIETRISSLSNKPLTTELDKVKKDIQLRDFSTKSNFSYELDSKVYTGDEMKELKVKLFDKLKELATKNKNNPSMFRNDSELVGMYRGFNIVAYKNKLEVFFNIESDNNYYSPANLKYKKGDEFNVNGFITRLDNNINGLDKKLLKEEEEISKLKKEMLNLLTEKKKPFKQMDVLIALRQDFKNIMTELSIMQRDSNYQSTWQPTYNKINPEIKKITHTL